MNHFKTVGNITVHLRPEKQTAILLTCRNCGKELFNNKLLPLNIHKYIEDQRPDANANEYENKIKTLVTDCCDLKITYILYPRKKVIKNITNEIKVIRKYNKLLNFGLNYGIFKDES